MAATPSEARQSAPARTRRAWVTPQVVDLPRLTELTLSTGPGIPCNGGIGGGSSTVCP